MLSWRWLGFSRRWRDERAFTLIEVLVVVAIIAVLIAVLVPSLAKAREMGRRAVCLSNLHQLGVGMSAYSVDQKGLLPTRKEFSYYIKSEYVPANYGILFDMKPVKSGNTVVSYKRTGRYIGKSTSLFYCPGFIDVSKMTGTWQAYGEHTFLDPKVELSFGGYIYAAPLAPGTAPTLRRTDIYSPKGKKSDGGVWHEYYVSWLTRPPDQGGKGFSANVSDPNSYLKYQPPMMQAIMADQIIGFTFIRYLHKDGLNTLFQDTHAKMVPDNAKRFLQTPASSGPGGAPGLYGIWEYLGRHY